MNTHAYPARWKVMGSPLCFSGPRVGGHTHDTTEAGAPPGRNRDRAPAVSDNTALQREVCGPYLHGFRLCLRTAKRGRQGGHRHSGKLSRQMAIAMRASKDMLSSRHANSIWTSLRSPLWNRLRNTGSFQLEADTVRKGRAHSSAVWAPAGVGKVTHLPLCHLENGRRKP